LPPTAKFSTGFSGDAQKKTPGPIRKEAGKGLEPQFPRRNGTKSTTRQLADHLCVEITNNYLVMGFTGAARKGRFIRFQELILAKKKKKTCGTAAAIKSPSLRSACLL
jgi:hypothetical protein